MTIRKTKSGKWTVDVSNGFHPVTQKRIRIIRKGLKSKKEALELEQHIRVVELKEKQLGREVLYAKLKEDPKLRWHRDEYKKLLKRFDEYYNKLEKKIADKEQQIVELTKLLEVLN